MKINLLTVGMLLAVSMNSDAQSVSTVQFSPASYTVNENAGTVTLVVERIGEPGRTAVVEYAVEDLLRLSYLDACCLNVRSLDGLS